MSRSRGALRRRQRGSAVLFIVAWLIFAILALGSWSLFEGQAAIGRMNAQFRADAVTSGMGVAARVYGAENACNNGSGLQFLNELYLQNGGEGPLECPLSAQGTLSGQTASAGFTTQEVEAVSGQFGGLLSYAGNATRETEVVAIHEFMDTQFEKELVNVVLILDMSRSMNENNRIGQLRQLLTFITTQLPLRPNLFGANAPAPNDVFINNVNLGVVFFDAATFNSMTIPITAPGDSLPPAGPFPQQTVVQRLTSLMQLNNGSNPTVQQILAVMGEDNGAGGTNYENAFKAAGALLANPVGGGDKFTVMISDGEPRIDDNGILDPAVVQQSARRAFNNEVLPKVHTGFLMLVGPEEFENFALDVSGPHKDPTDPARRALNRVDNLNDNNIATYFNNFIFFFQCWSGSLMPRLVAGDFPFPATWGWVANANGQRRHPLDFTSDPFEVGGVDDTRDDPGTALDESLLFAYQAANSFHYYIGDPFDDDGIDDLAVFYSEHVCRQLQNNNRNIILSHGWSSIVDHNRASLPYGINLPNFP